MPEISVVMPVYNGEDYLPEAIASILNQTFGDFEFLIVCEHGSSAASLEIVEKYAAKDKRIRPIHNSKRLGISASLNVGLKAAGGKYIARMDGDDVSGPRRFEVQKMFLDAYPDIGACGIYPSILYEPGIKGGYFVGYVSDPEQIACDLLFFTVLCHPTMMLRREPAQACLYDETLRGMEDRDFCVRLGQMTKLSNIMDPSLFSYRRTGINASRVYSDRDILLRKNILQDVLKKRLSLEFSNHQMDVLNFIGTAAYADLAPGKYVGVLQELEQLLDTIECRNRELDAYLPSCMTHTLQHRWFREKRKLERLVAKGEMPKAVTKRLSTGQYYNPWF